MKKCKLLGSLLDNNEEVKRRKILATNAANKLEHLFNNDNLTINTKMKLLNVYVAPIFLYNSETWTVNKTQEDPIDAFQRILIRKYILHIKWAATIRSNENLYNRTNYLPEIME